MTKNPLKAPEPTNRLTVLGNRLIIEFLGRSAPGSREAALSALFRAPAAVAYLRPIHSDHVMPAREGDCGEGDALWTRRRGLVLSIETADCVPVVIADADRVALVHAGWRGIVAGILPRAVRALGNPTSLVAWAGPAIRGCCFEVEQEVATLLVEASDESILTVPAKGKPTVDLVDAARLQLHAAGVGMLNDHSPCTRCRRSDFWSFRRDGCRAGRNYSFTWLSDGGGGSG